MKAFDKIIRVKDTYNTNDTLDRQYCNVYLTNYADYIEKSSYVVYGHLYIRHPYKWYELQRIWTIPSYFLLRSLSKFFNKDLNRHKTIPTMTRCIIFVIESLFAWTISKILDNIISSI